MKKNKNKLVNLQIDLIKNKNSNEIDEKQQNHISQKKTGLIQAESQREILAIIINIWRIKTKITNKNQEVDKTISNEDLKKIDRYINNIYNSLNQIGIEIIDRTGEDFDYGLPEKVVAAKPQAGIKKEIVIETIRPTIKWFNQIQPGEVEIATPIRNDEKGES